MTTVQTRTPREARLARKRRLAALLRWLHIYVSMLSFALVFFFAVTGLTLNHADKFADQTHTQQEKGRLDLRWVKTPDTLKIGKLQIVEYLRNQHGIKAALSDFRVDDTQIGVSFKGPGFAADAFINRDNGEYELTKTTAGFVGLINDLHKGRDTGSGWSLFIDIAAILLTLVSLTGILLLLYIKRRRLGGLLVAAMGLLLVFMVYKIWVK
ncbi:MAG TPA: PepSY-associated TM helix domain-containing protein [Puia sp.]|nr:PepSY-associated TM helix domain-containing protein [Puia sp.]